MIYVEVHSNLHILFSLLDSGSTQLVRHTAAQQLADVQKSHPDELFNLLNRIVPHLRSKHWETRTAATKAIGGIVDNAELWEPNTEGDLVSDEGIKNEIVRPNSTPSDNGDDQLHFDTLDIIAVVKNGKRLLGSSGKEYDFSLADLDPAERLALQKKNVTARLGLGGEYMEDELVTEKDFATSFQPLQTPRIDTSVGNAYRGQPLASPAVHSAMSPIDSAHNLQTPTEEGITGLSKRQQNMLKRKAKQSAKNHVNKVRVVDLAQSTVRKPSIDANAIQTPIDRTPHPVKQEGNGPDKDYFSLERGKVEEDAKLIVEHKGPAAPPASAIETSGEPTEWPFERLCELLLVDLFDPNWEIRHGAAMGIREVIRVHGAGAGRVRGKARKENDILNQRWLEDLGCRLCCIFMLDRFGDYVSDNVSPVILSIPPMV